MEGRLKIERNTFLGEDVSGSVKVHVVNGAFSKTFIQKNVYIDTKSTTQSPVAEYGLGTFILFCCTAYSGIPKRGYYMYNDLTIFDTQSDYEYWTALNQSAGILYICKHEDPCVLQAIKATDRALLYSYNTPDSATKYDPIFVDYYGRVWCIENARNKYVRVFDYTLTDMSVYELASGNPHNDAIDYITPTYDGLYLYVSGNQKLSKYKTALVNQGSPEWTVTLGFDPTCLWCDDDDAVYVLGTGNLYKYTSVGVQSWTTADAGGYCGFFSNNTNRIYFPWESNETFEEWTKGGARDGYVDTGTPTDSQLPAAIVSNDDDSYIWGLCGSDALGNAEMRWKMNHSDWSSPETEDDSKTVIIYYYRASGDPMGQIQMNMIASNTNHPTHGIKINLYNRNQIMEVV